MSLQLGAVKQLVLSIRQKICGVIRNVRECVRREAFPHTHYTVVHVERKSLQSEKPRSKITQCASGQLAQASLRNGDPKILKKVPWDQKKYFPNAL